MQAPVRTLDGAAANRSVTLPLAIAGEDASRHDDDRRADADAGQPLPRIAATTP